jgi:hypothetical protein
VFGGVFLGLGVAAEFLGSATISPNAQSTVCSVGLSLGGAAEFLGSATISPNALNQCVHKEDKYFQAYE